MAKKKKPKKSWTGLITVEVDQDLANVIGSPSQLDTVPEGTWEVAEPSIPAKIYPALSADAIGRHVSYINVKFKKKKKKKGDTSPGYWNYTPAFIGLHEAHQPRLRFRFTFTDLNDGLVKTVYITGASLTSGTTRSFMTVLANESGRT